MAFPMLEANREINASFTSDVNLNLPVEDSSGLIIQKSQRNKNIVYLNGYAYNECSLMKTKQACRYRCRNRRCGSKLLLDFNNKIMEQTAHNHEPDHERVSTEIATKKIKTIALESTATPKDIIMSVSKELESSNHFDALKRKSAKDLRDLVTKRRKKASTASLVSNHQSFLMSSDTGVLRQNSNEESQLPRLPSFPQLYDQAASQQPSQIDCDVMDRGRIMNRIKKIIPPMSFDAHKGQAGRIAVIGGSREYTGAPYFAAISALKVGADLVHVICPKEASPVIKAYSPELIVLPILDKENNLIEIRSWLDRMHAVVIGPGLGRLPSTFETVKNIISEIRSRNLPLVLDADGLYLATQEPNIIKGYTKAVLTPNIIEFRRLAAAMNVSSENTTELSQALQGPIIVKKGLSDVIASPTSELIVNEPGSPRRCGGQGDLLAGSLATFLHWEHSRATDNEDQGETSGGMIASYAACFLTKHCACRAYIKNGRSTTTSDLINEIHPIFSSIFENPQSSASETL